jgi:hypothetical protein
LALFFGEIFSEVVVIYDNNLGIGVVAVDRLDISSFDNDYDFVGHSRLIKLKTARWIGSSFFDHVEDLLGGERSLVIESGIALVDPVSPGAIKQLVHIETFAVTEMEEVGEGVLEVLIREKIILLFS